MRTKWITGILFLLAGCFPGADADYRGEVPPPKWVIYAYVEADSIVRAEVDKSGTYTDGMLPHTLWNPQGRVYLNGEYAGPLMREERNSYKSTVRPRQGDRVMICVSGEDCGDAVGETVVSIPRPEVEFDTAFSDGLFIVYAHLQDDGQALNYYRIQAERWEFYTHLSTTEEGPVVRTDTFVHYNNDVSGSGGLVTDNSSILGARRDLNPYNLFTNEENWGDLLTFHADFSVSTLAWTRRSWLSWRGDSIPYTARSESRIRMRIMRLDEPLYAFLYTLGLYERQIDINKEPSRVYSNVYGGLGVIGNYSVGEVVFDFKLPPGEVVSDSVPLH